jgi:hypothetical protein
LKLKTLFYENIQWRFFPICTINVCTTYNISYWLINETIKIILLIFKCKFIFHLFCKFLLSYYFVSFTLCWVLLPWKVCKKIIKQKLKALNDSKFKNEIEKDDMNVVIIIELTIIMPIIITFKLDLGSCFCAWIPLKNLEVFFKIEVLVLLLSSLLM